MKAIDVERFHGDLKAAIISGVPIEFDVAPSSKWSGRLTIARLDQLEKLLLAKFDSGFSADPEIDPPADLPRRYWAALQTFARTDSMLPVLEGLTTRRLAHQEVAQVLCWPFIYLFILLACAFAGLAFFSTRVVPSVAVMQADLGAPGAFDIAEWIPWLLMILGGCLFLLLIWLVVGGATKSAMWLGGRYYLHCRIKTMVFRLVQMLMDTGVSLREAVSIGCELTQTDLTARQHIETTAQKLENSSQMSALADYLTASADQRLAHLRVTIPIALVTSLGGVIALTYCVMIFWPIISMLKELSRVGV